MQGETNSTANGAAGVYGEATASSGQTRGVSGKSGSPGGHGVYGEDLNGGVGVGGYSNSNSGVYGHSTSGPGVYGQSTSNSGVYGQSSSGSGVYGQSTSGSAVKGIASSGVGVYGQNTSSTRAGNEPGVYGTANAEDGGQFFSTQSNGIFASGGNVGAWATGSNVGVHGSSADGVGVRGCTTTGTAIKAEGNGASTTALEINNGALQMTGSAAPVLVVESQSSCCVDVIIDHPLSNGDPNAIILVTPVQVSGVDYTEPIGVHYVSNTWRITNLNIYRTIPMGQKFNVLIIKR